MTMKLFKQFLLLLSFLLSIGIAHAQPYVMKIGTATINDAQHEWIKRFQAEIANASNDRIKVEAYPASQLGTIPRMIEQVQFNTIQGWIGPSEFLNGVDTRFSVLGAPGVFQDADHTFRVTQDPRFTAVALSIGEKKGIKGLGMFISGPATFVTNKPIRRSADFSGMKIRVTASDLAMAQIRELKAAAVPMSLGEVLPALQQGALDGVMGNAPVFSNLRYHSVAKYQTVTGQMTYVSYVAISRLWFEKLPADLQKVVEETGRKVTVEIHPFAVEEIERATKDWTDSGGEVLHLSEEDQRSLMERLRRVGEETAGKRSADREIFKLMTEVASTTGK